MSPMTQPSCSEQRKILIVDDEPSIRTSLKRLLEFRGCSVKAVPDLDQAVSAVEGEPFDALLVDVILPGIRGPQVAERLQTVQPNLVVIFMSGYPRHALEDVRETDHHLVGKPFEIDELYEAIDKALGEK